MAARFWISGTGNWNDTTHWSTTSGGSSGAAVPTSSDDVTFDSNSGTSAAVSINIAANANTITINKSDLTLTDNTGLTVVGAVTLTTGTFNTNGQTESWGSFSSSNSNTRTLTLGASAITITGASPWSTSTITSFTFNANTSTITFSNGTANLTSGVLTFNNVIFSGSSEPVITGSNGITFSNLTRNGIAATNSSLSINVNITITGTFTYNGNSLINRGFVHSNQRGGQRTISLGASGTTSISNVDFQDIIFTGTNAPVSGTSIGNAGNNSGITFTASVTRYWVGNGGNWSSTTHWSTSSGGASGSSIPLAQDTVVFDNNSITSTAQTITVDMARVASLDFTNVLNNPTISLTVTTPWANCLGNLIMVSGMTMSQTTNLNVGGDTNSSITTNGVTITKTIIITATPGVIVTITDNFISNTSLQLIGGTLTVNGNVNITTFSGSTNRNSTRVLNMGSGIWNLTGTGTVWDYTFTTNFTHNANTSTIIISDRSSSSKTFTGGGKTFYNLTINGEGSGLVIFSDGNTFTNFTIFAPKSVQFQSTTTTTIQNFIARGSANRLVTITASTGASAATLASTGATWECDYLSLQDNAGTGNTKYAGSHSTNVSGNSGWTFTDPPTRSSGQAPQPTIRNDIMSY